MRKKEIIKILHTALESYVGEIGSGLESERKPKDLEGIYGFRGEKFTSYHGIKPSYVIRNEETGRSIYVEIKRQSNSGNAHERACKYMMPGIIKSAQEIAKQPEGIIPFWWIFAEDIATDRYYAKEIMHWFQGMERHVLLWKNVKDRKPVIEHFEKHIRPLLGL